ncbi:TetR/AcrR family transcriptional regulator [Kribbella pittospori]|uniref:TetR/AcrR family transcriptional regulator n=1 Tax=Kribbella pittospori TaxID=722689 RepID=A0A4R0K2Y1_9ACTN|nr:TetR family transcriptional regulator [Kribbella pittospori]TCC52088.1 TetR/AcrR family transcriptional regulator [Kribbella pittospori]
MRSTQGSDSEPPVGTAARIRDAALQRFGRDGFSAGLRAVAADAGVTAGLVVHHFGSKDGLRAACDAYVLEFIHSEKMKATTRSVNAIAQLAEVEQYAPYAMYALRSMQAGGELGKVFVDRMAKDAEDYLEAGVQSGMIRPSRDPAARARWLTYQHTGSLLLWMSLHGKAVEVSDFRDELRRMSDEITLPALELFTDGLFVDRTMLDDYLMYVPDPPAAEQR